MRRRHSTGTPVVAEQAGCRMVATADVVCIARTALSHVSLPAKSSDCWRKASTVGQSRQQEAGPIFRLWRVGSSAVSAQCVTALDQLGVREPNRKESQQY